MPSSTVENYLKKIYLLEQNSQTGQVAMGHLATAMAVAPGTITSMIKALQEAGLVDYEPRSGATLTDKGRTLALHVLRRHRLVELFLVRVLGLDWAEVHDEAEELEHVISDKVLERLDALLGHPRFDPHGDPIPTALGQVANPTLQSLTECPLHQKVRIARVVDQDPKFLQFVNRSGLTPGTTVVLSYRDPDADAVTLAPDAGSSVTIGTTAAAKIFVEAIDNEPAD